MTLSNKTAIVTGAGRGLGKGIALKLATEGARVVVADLMMENAQSVVELINAAGGRALPLRVNVADKNDVAAMFDLAIDTWGTVDIMVSNAGINRDAQLYKMSDADWDQVIAVNLSGTFYCTRRAAQIMREKEYGRIINIASMSWLGNFGQCNYAAAKAGVVGLTRTASRELARKGVTCNAICPGFIETEMTSAMPEKAWEIMVGKIASGRVGSAEDVAHVVAFLASDQASYVTGEVINVSGGMVL